MKSLKRIFITSEAIGLDEPSVVSSLLENGWDMAHLRHPGASWRDMRNLIEAIPQQYHRRLRLHGHFELAAHFNLGGLHLNGRCPQPPAFYTGPVSRSCHSLDDVLASGECDYVTLSPVFDSISKPGYRSAFTANELRFIIAQAPVAVIALGGVTPERIDEIGDMGFSGYAVKGAIDLFR